jgi:NodT family efflux transporter outer membrane factor (OMF) lipoprotein
MRRVVDAIVRKGKAWYALLLLLSGCAVGPNYTRPDAALAPFHNAAAVVSPSAGAPAPLDRWWTGFNDPELVVIIQRALDQNLDLAAAFARVEQARAVAKATGAELLPTADLNASAASTHQSLESPFGAVGRNFPGFDRDEHEYSVGPAASWEIDLFGGLRRGAKAASEEAQAAEADRTGVRVTVAADAADAYLEVRGYQARLAVAQSQVETDERLLGLVEDRRRAGSAEGREVAQAEALLKQARASLSPLRIGLDAQLNRLDVLMGVQPGTYAAELSAERAIPSIPAIGGADQPLEVLRRRPDVIAAERRLAASNERIGQALADYYPKISLSGALGVDSISGSRLFTSDAFTAAGAGALRWRLFDFGRVDAEVKQARGANAEALALYRQTVLKAAEDVENALMSLSETQVYVAELQTEVDSLTRARDLSQQAYKAGSITLTDVLEADRQLLVARDALDANRAAAARAAVQTFRALGGGWDTAGRPPSIS